MIKKRSIAAATAAVMGAVLISGTVQSVYADDARESSLCTPISFEEYGLGCEQEDVPASYDTESADHEELRITSADLSTDPAFPPIGNQGSLNSCTAWATTYYAYTYRVNKAKGITSTSSNSYSPRWTYNLANYGQNIGIGISTAFEILKNQGALKLTDYPYTTSGEYSYDWSHNTQAMIDALSTRVSNYGTGSIPSVYNSTFNTELTKRKIKISNGSVNVVAMYADTGLTNANIKRCSDSTHNNEYILVRNSNASSGHAMAVVGFDDNVWCDVNGNGVQDTGETGAFKLANSWGSSWGNSGYIWVLYDALLGTSRINSASDSSVTWDSSLTSTRVPVFDYGNSSNVFYFCNVADYDVGYVSEVTFTTSRRNQFSADSRCKYYTDSDYTSSNISNIYNGSSAYKDYNVEFSGTIVLNHKQSENLNTYLSGYKWGNQIIDSQSDAYSVNNVSCKLADNLGNIITSYRSSGSANGGELLSETNLFLSYGDVNYDRQLTTSDADMILSYLVNSTNFSNVQKKLADYNNDGVVSMADVTAILTYLNNRGVDTSVIEEKIERYYASGLIS